MSTNTKFRSRLIDKIQFDSIMDQVKKEAPVKPVKQEKKQYSIPHLRTHVNKAVNAFLNTESKKERFGSYFIDGSYLYYRAGVVESGQVVLKENTIGYRINEDTVIGNSSLLNLLSATDRYNRRRQNATEVQTLLGDLVPMIPFSVIEQAKLDITTIEFVERGPEEQIIRSIDSGKRDKKTNEKIIIDETVHFTGASLIRFKQDNDYDYFLFDLDRNEIKHKIFNPFLVKLPHPVNTIKEAYESLKPQAVKEAESKGIPVKRQGEFFFVRTDSALNVKEHCDKSDQWRDKLEPIEMELRAGNNRPNRAQYGIAKKMYVSGKVRHTGREHKTITLKGWWKAYANTAIESFTITGDID